MLAPLPVNLTTATFYEKTSEIFVIDIIFDIKKCPITSLFLRQFNFSKPVAYHAFIKNLLAMNLFFQ